MTQFFALLLDCLIQIIAKYFQKNLYLHNPFSIAIHRPTLLSFRGDGASCFLVSRTTNCCPERWCCFMFSDVPYNKLLPWEVMLCFWVSCTTNCCLVSAVWVCPAPHAAVACQPLSRAVAGCRRCKWLPAKCLIVSYLRKLKAMLHSMTS